MSSLNAWGEHLAWHWCSNIKQFYYCSHTQKQHSQCHLMKSDMFFFYYWTNYLMRTTDRCIHEFQMVSWPPCATTYKAWIPEAGEWSAWAWKSLKQLNRKLRIQNTCILINLDKYLKYTWMFPFQSQLYVLHLKMLQLISVKSSISTATGSCFIAFIAYSVVKF